MVGSCPSPPALLAAASLAFSTSFDNMERTVVDEYEWERLVKEGADNAATREMFLELLQVKDFPDKKVEQDRILVMANFTPLRPDRRIPFSLTIERFYLDGLLCESIIVT